MRGLITGALYLQGDKKLRETVWRSVHALLQECRGNPRSLILLGLSDV